VLLCRGVSSDAVVPVARKGPPPLVLDALPAGGSPIPLSTASRIPMLTAVVPGMPSLRCAAGRSPAPGMLLPAPTDRGAAGRCTSGGVRIPPLRAHDQSSPPGALLTVDMLSSAFQVPPYHGRLSCVRGATCAAALTCARCTDSDAGSGGARASGAQHAGGGDTAVQRRAGHCAVRFGGAPSVHAAMLLTTFLEARTIGLHRATRRILSSGSNSIKLQEQLRHKPAPPRAVG
jgi:hypothetical protein